MTDIETPTDTPEPPRCPWCGTRLNATASVCPACGRAVGQAPPDVDIGGWLNASWRLFADNVVSAILLPLVAYIPSVPFLVAGYFAFVVLGALMWSALHGHHGPGFAAAFFVLSAVLGTAFLAFFALVLPALEAGVYAAFLRGIRSGKLTSADLMAGFRNWWACTWVSWVLGLATLVSLLFTPVLIGFPMLYGVQTLRWLALFRIVDRRAGGVEALAFAWEVLHGRLWMTMLFTFLMSLLTAAGAAGLGIGILITAPLGIGALAAGYHALSLKHRPGLAS